jgi:6-aminohexanoate-oligomer endohydrolase
MPPIAALLLLAATTHIPRTNIESARWLTIDFPAMRIGVAEYDDGPTGTTIFHFPKGAKAAVDVRGGAPGTINTDTLRLGYDSAFIDAVTFAGGSSYGLAVATGVAQAIKATQDNPNQLASIATVTGAIIFDVGPRRYSTVVPDEILGRAAFDAAAPGRFPLGAHGAGRFAMQSGYFGDDYRSYSGQGGAFRQIGPTKIAVFTVVNALGAVVDRGGNIVRCAKPPCGTIAARLASVAAGFSAPSVPTPATTLTLVVTNQKLPFWALQRLAMQVHASMARAIQPFHTTNDGDVLFALSTDEVENEKLNVADLGVVASEVAWDAVLSSVPELDDVGRASARPDGLKPVLHSAVGAYEFAFGRGARATIARSGDALTITANRNSIYLPANTPVALTHVSGNDYRIANARGARLRIDENGFTINPGHWPIRATRVAP